MPVLGDDLEAVEVCSHLAHVVDHARNTEEGRVPAVVLHKCQVDVAQCYGVILNIQNSVFANALTFKEKI